MRSKRTILTYFVILAAAILLQFSQNVTATTFEEMLQQLQDEKLIQNVEGGVFTNLNSEPSKPFTAYSIISPSEKKTYFYFGSMDEEVNKSTSNKILFYRVAIEVPGEEQVDAPKVNNCTLFIKQGKSFLSHTVTLNQSTFNLKPIKFPNSISLDHSNHLYQCVYDSPKPEQEKISQIVEIHTAAGFRGTRIFANYWTYQEKRQGKPFTPEEKTSFCQNVEFQHDNYDITTNKPDDAKHSITLTNLANDYKDNDLITIRLSGVDHRFINGNWKRELECIIKQTRVDGGEEKVLHRQLLLASTNEKSPYNPYIILRTGKVDTEESIQYYAGSTLSIQCPEIFLYKSKYPQGPNYHISSVVHVEKGLSANPKINPAISCANYPCSIFIQHPERQKDNIPDENMIYYIIGGGVLALILIGGIFRCARSKRRSEEETHLLN